MDSSLAVQTESDSLISECNKDVCHDEQQGSTALSLKIQSHSLTLHLIAWPGLCLACALCPKPPPLVPGVRAAGGGGLDTDQCCVAYCVYTTFLLLLCVQVGLRHTGPKICLRGPPAGCIFHLFYFCVPLLCMFNWF